MNVFGINKTGSSSNCNINFLHSKSSFAAISNTTNINYDKFVKSTSFKGILKDSNEEIETSLSEAELSTKVARKAFKKIEANIFGPLAKNLAKTDETTASVEKVDDAYLSKLFKIPNTKDYLTKLFAAHIVRIVFDTQEQTGEKINREFVFSYMKSNAENKAEACKEGLDGIKESADINPDIDLNLQALIYKKIARACEILAKEIH